jgi:CelD/BcsL family acetyltransferase involved in cellulose biosynthesis
LWIGAEVAAVYYGFHTSSRDYFYIGGFDPSFSSIGAGSLTIAAAIDRAIAERSLAFDLLGGREPYKYEWGPSIARGSRATCNDANRSK